MCRGLNRVGGATTHPGTQPGAAEFAGHLRQHQARLYGYIHSLVGDLNDADDLFQQTTLVLWKNFSSTTRVAVSSPGPAGSPAPITWTPSATCRYLRLRAEALCARR